MKKLFFALVALVSVLSAQASVNGPMDSVLFDAQVNENTSYYETLGEMFKNGQKPVLSKMINLAWAGRCFLADKADEPTNAGLMVKEKKSPDAGPIGNGAKNYEGASYWSRSQAADYYDNLTIAQVIALPNHNFSFYGISESSTSIELSTTNDKSVFRTSGEYIIEELSTLKDSTTIYARCYYFISHPKE